MTLKEQIVAELATEFDITKIAIFRDESRGRPGTVVDVVRAGGLTNSWFFSAVNKMTAAEMVTVMRTYLVNDKRKVKTHA